MQIPQKIGKYTIVERIGRGGMGYVYRAIDPLLKRDVALKTMLKDVSEDPELRGRFIREAQSAGGLRHPNIVTIYDLGEDDQGCPFIAMEFLTGTDLEQIIKSKIDLMLSKKLDILIQTSIGLGYAHNNGIVHRDIKPANIRLLDNGDVKIMDFGIAKISASHFTRTGMIMGTPHYMAPEQIRGEKVDRRADIFSLGVVLYELVTFRKPFPGDNPTTVLFKIIHSQPEPLTDAQFTAPEGLEEVVQKALAKTQEERYQTCEELAEDLMAVFNSVHVPDSTQVGIGAKTPLPYSIGRTPLPSQKRTPLPGSRLSKETILPKTQIAAKTPPPAVLPPPEMPGETVITPTPSMTPRTGPTLQQHAQPALGKTYPSAPPLSSEARKWLLFGSLAFVALIVAAYIAFYKWRSIPEPVTPAIVEPVKPPVPKPSPPVVEIPKKEQEPAPAPILSGWLSLNIQPWAEIRELKNEQGNLVDATASMTPCKLQLPVGKYEIVLANPQFKPLTLKVEIRNNSTTVVKRRMEGFDYARAVDSLQL